MASQPAVARYLNQHDYNHADDSQYKRLRDLAEQEYKQKKHYSEASQAAYNGGDHGEAKRLSDLSKSHAAKMDDYNAQAAAFVFRANNADSAGDEIDLHGLYVKEAIEILQTRIDASRSRHESHLKVIVGKGMHSENHVAKIKPAVEKACREQNIKWEVEHDNSGVIILDLRPSYAQYQQGPQYPPSQYPPSQYPPYQQTQYPPQQQQQDDGGLCCGLIRLLGRIFG